LIVQENKLNQFMKRHKGKDKMLRFPLVALEVSTHLE
jgi:hypothetical protein